MEEEICITISDKKYYDNFIKLLKFEKFVNENSLYNSKEYIELN